MDTQTAQEETKGATLPVLTYEQFRKLYKAARNFQAYDHNDRARHASSHRLGFRQREALGEFYYTHDLCPDRAFDTAQGATRHAYEVYLAAIPLRDLMLAVCKQGLEALECHGLEDGEAGLALKAAIAKQEGAE